MHSGAGEWIWRPLRNPARMTVSSFMDKDPRGFGLLQRDRAFASYQDLEAEYHQRPGYWVEPIGPWGEGQVDLVEIPTTDETSDNIVAYWHPARPVEPGQETVVSYRLRALSSVTGMHPGKGGEHLPGTAAGERLEWPERPDASALHPGLRGQRASISAIPPRCSSCRPRRPARSPTAGVPNDHTKGFARRARRETRSRPKHGPAGFLKAGNRTLTETWTYPWAVD